MMKNILESARPVKKQQSFPEDDVAQLDENTKMIIDEPECNIENHDCVLINLNQREIKEAIRDLVPVLKNFPRLEKLMLNGIYSLDDGMCDDEYAFCYWVMTMLASAEYLP